MADRIRDAHALDAVIDSHLVEPFQSLWLGARCVFGDIHHGHAVSVCELDRLLARLEHSILVPFLCKLADRARKDKEGSLNLDSRFLCDLDDRNDIGLHGSRGAVGIELHLRASDLLG